VLKFDIKQPRCANDIKLSVVRKSVARCCINLEAAALPPCSGTSKNGDGVVVEEEDSSMFIRIIKKKLFENFLFY
jgi:hypothetical protein